MQIEFTGIAATLKGNHTIVLTATAPDDREKTVNVPCEDIAEIYGQNCVSWFLENQDRENALWELFHSIAGIKMELI